jgi:hypothetical protein
MGRPTVMATEEIVSLPMSSAAEAGIAAVGNSPTSITIASSMLNNFLVLLFFIIKTSGFSS